MPVVVVGHPHRLLDERAAHQLVRHWLDLRGGMGNARAARFLGSTDRVLRLWAEKLGVAVPELRAGRKSGKS